MANISHIFATAKKLLVAGYSVIPTYDADKGVFAKKPCFKKDEVTGLGGWDIHKTQLISQEELLTRFDKYNTNSFAVITGAVSGNLELIDVDTKARAGIDAVYFTAIEKFNPGLWQRLRIHETPSGGKHLVYHVPVNEKIPGNKKLAGFKDESDLKKNGSPTEKYFIETRGEGGYFLFPPSCGYKILKAGGGTKEKPFPLITWAERCFLIYLAITFTEILKPPVKEKIYKSNNESFYEESPYKHYNNSDEGADTLTNLGWASIGESGPWAYFTRPGGDGIGASWHKEKRFFYIWTTSGEFETSKPYSAGAILCFAKFGGDWKKLYAWLVSQKYGKIKPELEREIVRKAAKLEGKIPENVSESAKKEYEEIKAGQDKKYPHGIFWEETEKGVAISQERVFNVALALGFCSYKNELCYKSGVFIERVVSGFLHNALKSYIKEEDANIYESIANAYELFLHKYGKFTQERICEMEQFAITPEMILQSTKQLSYKFFKNCYVSINRDGLEIMSYNATEKLIWKNNVMPRDFSVIESRQGLYYEFLGKAIGWSKYLCEIIGFYLHDYRDQEAYMVICVENGNGGSGKNLFASLLKIGTSYWETPGAQVKADNTLFQGWNYERVAALHDLPKNFNFEALKNVVNGTSSIKKLYKDIGNIDLQDMPKLLATTNFSIDNKQPGFEDRFPLLEFTAFFNRTNNPVKKYFGNKMFPGDWDAQEYSYFDNIMCGCIEAYLKADCIIERPELSGASWVKQYDYKYNILTRHFIEQNIEGWEKKGLVPTAEFNRQYFEYCHAENINKKYELSSIRMNQALADYCLREKIVFDPAKMNGILGRCRYFGQAIPENVTSEDLPF